MSEDMKVGWTIKEFPCEVRKRFVATAKEVNFTCPGLMETVLVGWFTEPTFPEPQSEIAEGTVIGPFFLNPFPLNLKNRFVAAAHMHEVTVAVLLDHVLNQYFQRLEQRQNA